MEKCILVVDDDEMNLKRTKIILQRHYDLLFAESGEEALDLLRIEKIDMVLLDIEMPNMNGIETFEHMREEQIDIPVIFLTASGDEDNVLDALSMGAVNYLKKPFIPQELLKRVAKGFEKDENGRAD